MLGESLLHRTRRLTARLTRHVYAPLALLHVPGNGYSNLIRINPAESTFSPPPVPVVESSAGGGAEASRVVHSLQWLSSAISSRLVSPSS